MGAAFVVSVPAGRLGAVLSPWVLSRAPWSFGMFVHPAAQESSSLCAYVGSALHCACPEKYNRPVLLFQVFVPFIM